MSWTYGMDHDKSRWKSVSKNLKKQGYTILGNDGEYLYWCKWEGGFFKKKTRKKSMAEIKKMLVDDYQVGG